MCGTEITVSKHGCHIIHVHPNDANWHIYVDSILLDTTKGLMELLTAMIELNR
jgi:hypothetical protein